MTFGWNSGPSVPAMACRQTEREKEKKKREKREKHKSATVKHQEINKCCISITNINQKPYCNLLLKEEEEKIGINKLHTYTIIIHLTLVQHIQECHIIISILIDTNMLN
jgi:hypothetical protein